MNGNIKDFCSTTPSETVKTGGCHLHNEKHPLTSIKNELFQVSIFLFIQDKTFSVQNNEVTSATL